MLSVEWDWVRLLLVEWDCDVLSVEWVWMRLLLVEIDWVVCCL